MRWDIAAEKLMSMNDEVWMRHANPWSGWSRIGTAPFFFLAFWSYIWLGWFSLIPIGLVCLWTYLNPRIFPKAKSTDNWVSKGVLGERVFINRKNVAIPKHHELAGQITTALAAMFMVAAIYGFVVKDFWAAFLGYHAAFICKIWFIDRMVWLYEDMKQTNEEYKSWSY